MHTYISMLNPLKEPRPVAMSTTSLETIVSNDHLWLKKKNGAREICDSRVTVVKL